MRLEHDLHFARAERGVDLLELARRERDRAQVDRGRLAGLEQAFAARAAPRAATARR